MKKNNVGRPAFENASTRTFKLNDGEYFVVKALVDCLRNLYSYNELNDGDFPYYVARHVVCSARDFKKNLKS